MCRGPRAIARARVTASRPSPAVPSRLRPGRRPGMSAGFNLIELLMAMALSTMIFMSITMLYTYQGEALQQQASYATMQSEARFALDHLSRDLVSLGSNTSPNTLNDAMVCPKPTTTLRVISLDPDNGHVYLPDINTNTKKLAVTLFGSLDVKQRFRTASIAGDTVVLLDEAMGTSKLPATKEAWDQIFSTDRYLRVSSSDGSAFYYPIASTSFSGKSVKLSGAPPQVGGSQRCGYQGFGGGMWVDVQGFIRYRTVADQRPGSPKDSKGRWRRTLLVRERLATDGLTPTQSLVLAENAIEIDIYDVGYDQDPTPDNVSPFFLPMNIHMVQAGGAGLLGTTLSALPEEIRFLTIKVSVRSEFENRELIHQPRDFAFLPLRTFKIDDTLKGAAPVVTLGGRVTMPTMVSRNL